MTDRKHNPGGNDNTESAADEATDASRDTWQQFGQRAEDEKRLDRGKGDAETGGTSPTPDVDLLADSLNSLADKVSGRDSDEEPRTP